MGDLVEFPEPIRTDLPLADDEIDEQLERIRESQEELDAANAMLDWVRGLRP